jgi:hypothetical protein
MRSLRLSQAKFGRPYLKNKTKQTKTTKELKW